jgi:hypothetical protein
VAIQGRQHQGRPVEIGAVVEGQHHLAHAPAGVHAGGLSVQRVEEAREIVGQDGRQDGLGVELGRGDGGGLGLGRQGRQGVRAAADRKAQQQERHRRDHQCAQNHGLARIAPRGQGRYRVGRPGSS